MISEYEHLTGFRPTKRERRFVLLFDYGYGPDKWVVVKTADTFEAIRRERRKYPKWGDDMVRILDQEEKAR